MDADSPLVFLDIDGVICCNNWFQLEEDKLQQVGRICRETGAKVVLSSDWRRKTHLKQKIQRALLRVGVTYVGCTRVIRTTQQIGNHWQARDANQRPREILKWYGHRTCPWLAIDDRYLVNEPDGEHLQGHFVHTNYETGLTAKLADQAIAILSKPQAANEPGLQLQYLALMQFRGSHGILFHEDDELPSESRDMDVSDHTSSPFGIATSSSPPLTPKESQGIMTAALGLCTV